MTDEPSSRRAPRARPVAEVPIASLLERAEELARRWAIALVIDAPIELLGEIPLEEIACEGPALVSQALRAVVADAELQRLTGEAAGPPRGPTSAERLRAIAGSDDDAAAVVAVEALRGVLWEALLAELREPSARLAADACDRLAFVSASLLRAALDPSAADAVRSGEEDRADPVGGERGRPRHASAATIIDEHPGAAESWRSPGGDRREALVGSVPEREPAERSRGGAPEIEIRDERGASGPAAWVGSIGRALERFREDGRPFAVLLIELRDIERLRRAGTGAELSALSDRVADALEAELGGFPPGTLAPRAQRDLDRTGTRGSLTREGPGRYWLLAHGTDRSGASRLAERLAGAVAAAGARRGATLEVAIGSAICPEDGHDASVLAAHADVGLFADRAALARRPARVDEPA